MKLIFARGPVLGFRFILLAMLSITLMILDHQYTQFKKFRDLLVMSVTPIQYLVDGPIKVLGQLKENVVTHRYLLVENERLKDEQIALNVRLQKMALLEQENQQLRGLLKASPAPKEGRIMLGQLVSVASDLFIHELVVDKGSQDNVFIGQTVLDANGIVGQVIESTPSTSRVLLLTDVRSAVPVTVLRTGMRGIVEGTGNLNYLSLVNVSTTTDIKEGDVLISSNLGGRFPVGYRVGSVSAVAHVPGERFANVRVEPSAFISRSQPVILLWPPQDNSKEAHNARSG